MSPSGADIDITFNPQSIIEGFRKIDKARQDMEKGVAGSVQKWEKAFADFSQQIVTVSQRANRAQENYVRSIERQAAAYGKSGVEKLIAQRDQIIKRLGNEEELVKRVTAAYQKMIDVEKQRGTGGPGTGQLLFRGARDIFEGRMTYGMMDVGRAVLGGMGGAVGGGAAAGGTGMFAGISGATIAIGGLSAALAGTVVVGYKGAEAMGEYARQLREIQGVTGMSVREVQQLEVAAKMSGRSIQDIIPAMRGFTQALEGSGSSSVKASQDFQKMGVDVVGLKLGTTSLYEAFVQMGEALKRNPDAFETNIQLMDIMKRSGLADKQMLDAMKEAADRTKDLHIFSEDEVKQMDEMRKTIEGAEVAATNLFRRLEFEAGKTFEIDVKLVMQAVDQVGRTIDFDKAILMATGVMAAPPPPAPPQPPGIGAAQTAMQQALSAEFDRFIGGDNRTLRGAEQKLQQLEKEWNDIHENNEKNRAAYVKDSNAYLANERRVTDELQKQKDLVEALRKAESDRRSNAEELRKLHLHVADLLRDQIYRAGETTRLFREYSERSNVTPAQVKEASDALKPVLEMELKLAQQRGQGIAAGEARKISDIIYGQPVTAEQVARQSGVGFVERMNQQFEREQKIWAETIGKENEEFIKAAEGVLEASRRLDLVRAEGAAKVGYALGPQDINARMAEQQRLYDAEVQAAQDEFDKKASLIDTVNTKEEVWRTQLHELQMDFILREAEARNKYTEAWANEVKQQMNEIQKTVEPLYQTLFTHPSKFGAQLRTTVQQAALRPLVSGLSETTATILHPLIFGESGTGGIAGGFRNIFGGGGGRLNDVRLTPDGSLPVHVTNIDIGGPIAGGALPITGTSMVDRALMRVGIGGGVSYAGGGGYGVTSPGGLFGAQFRRYITGGPMAQAPTAPNWSVGFGDFGGSASSEAANIQTPGFSGGLPISTTMSPIDRALTNAGIIPPAGSGGNRGGAGPGAALGKKVGDFLGKYIGGSYAGSGGLSRIPTNIGEYGGAISSTTASTAARIQALSTGPFAGTPAGPAAGSIGLMLASAGIFGEQRGQLGGVAMAAGGGFLAAGPIGAAVGAGIGFGEMIAGVESPRHEAVRLVNQYYHININNSTADQIVAIANQSYGGTVSLAVRSPQVRQMLGLYAAGTGQANRFTATSDMPHGASLVESGGGLYQQATYQYGQAYTYGSTLPVYGGVSTLPLSAPGNSNISLSLNIGGQNAAQFLQGNVVSPDVVQTQYASAMQGSSGRVPQALMMSEPGSIAG